MQSILLDVLDLKQNWWGKIFGDLQCFEAQAMHQIIHKYQDLHKFWCQAKI